MANLKEVRDRIKSVSNTKQITKAMKMVSAAKLRKAQQAIVEMRPYSDKLDSMLRNILASLEGDVATAFGTEREVQKACLVLVTSDRGLCGAFNSNIIKEFEAAINGKFSAHYNDGNLDVIAIGKRGFDYLKRNHAGQVNLISDYVDTITKLTFETTSAISQRLMDAFENGEYDAVEVVYGRFKNAAMQFPTTHQWLPVAPMENDDDAVASDYIFEPSKEELLEYLVPTILQTSFHKFILDNHASEHGARMTAMDKASENADELLKELKLQYNKARQEAITNEILEIVGGAAALDN